MRLLTEVSLLPLFIVLLHSTYINLLTSVHALLPLPLHLFFPPSGMFFPCFCAWFTTFIPGLCKQRLLLLPGCHPPVTSQPPAASTTSENLLSLAQLLNLTEMMQLCTTNACCSICHHWTPSLSPLNYSSFLFIAHF